MTLNFHQKMPKVFLAACIAVAVIFSLGIRFIHLEKDFKKNRQLYFFENDVPLMTTLDAYFYLKIAKNVSPGGSYRHFDPRLLPLLSVMTASIHKATGMRLEKIAFYIPPLLACLMLLIYFWWGRELGGTTLFAVAALIGMGSYYWYTRTCLGRFDTDSLIPFFVYGISFLSYKVSVIQPWKRRLLYLAAGLALCYVFQWWWHPGRSLALPLLIAPYAVSVFFWPCNRIEKGLKAFILVSGSLLAITLLFSLYDYFPRRIASLFKPLASFMELLTGTSENSFSEVGPSISELTPATLELVAEGVAGHLVLLCLSAFGFFVLAKRHFRFLAVMICPLGFALGCIFARRLLIFLVPVYALSLAYFLAWFSERKFLDNIPPMVKQWGIIGMAVFIIAVNSAKAATITIAPKATSYQVSLAKSAKDTAKPHAMMWNWWDQGYFLAFYAERRTIMDGGNQTPDRMFITAFPLSVNDPVLAANWIKFFATRGANAYHSIKGRLRHKSKTVEFLKKALSEKEPLDSLLKDYGLKDERYWRNYLFPKAEVYLYLNHELFEKAPWWFYFGSGKSPSEPGTRPKASFFKPGRFSIDARKGDIAFEDRLMSLSALYLSKSQPIPRVVAHRTFKGQSGPVALWVRDLDMSYLFDNAMEDSLFIKLLLFEPYSPPKGFELVKYVPLQGGLWKVR